MDIIYPQCAGIDVHKKSIEVCIRLMQREQVKTQTRHFGTMTGDLLLLSDWLAKHGVTHVAMESTGVFWKPIFNLLEGQFTVILVNARHVRQVPGKKTDVKDCQWLAKLMQHGLLTASFIPDTPQRDLRDLTRYRRQVISERSREFNRIQKVLEDANLKPASVMSDMMGVSGREILQALVDGETDPKVLAQMAKRRMRSKIPELELALEGRVREHHRFMLRIHLERVHQLELTLAAVDARIEELMRPFTEEINRLSEIPGVDVTVAELVIAEVGTDMSKFETANHLCSWAGLVPGNNESAGKRKSGTITQGNRWLKPGLVQAAWAASHSKNSYLAVMYRRIMIRRGAKRALIAVAHAILVIMYEMLRNGTSYVEMGTSNAQKKDPQRQAKKLIHNLQLLGYNVVLTPTKSA